MKTNQVRIRVSPDDWDTLGTLSAGHITKQSVAAYVLAAACAAIRENGGRVSMPLQFTVGIHDAARLELNEPRSGYKVKK